MHSGVDDDRCMTEPFAADATAAPVYGPMPVYGWVPQYYWDPRWGWVPQYVWHPQYGWVHGFIWAPLPPGWGEAAAPGPERYSKAPHTEPTSYLRLLRTPTYGWWKSLLGLLLALTVWFVGSVVLLVVAVVAMGGDTERLLDDIATDPLGSPTSLLIVNINLALLIPSVWVAVLAVHQERLAWVSSVVRRLRLRLLLTFVAVSTVLLGIGLFVGYLIVDPVAGSGEDSYDSGFIIGMLAVVLLTTPLQAAGEEYLFRGYLSQVVACWIPPRAAGAILAGLVTGLLFALAHGSQDVPTFLSRLAFGLTASLVAWLTGGLEASIAYHVMNNVLLFLLALVVGPSLEVEISGALVLTVDVLVMLAYITFVWWWSRRRPVQRDTGGPAAAQAATATPEMSLSGPSRLG